MSDLTNILTQCGLSEKEAAVYLAACELGSVTANDIAKKSGVNRATTYVCLESLEGRGFMTNSSAGRKTVFIAERPTVILDGLRKEKGILAKREMELEDVLPELVAMYNVEGKKPRVLFMEGQEGLRAVHAEFENLRGPYFQITNIDDARESFKGIEKDRADHHKRMRKGTVVGRALLVTKKPFADLSLGPLPVDTKFLHYEEFPMHGEIIVREDTVVVYSFKVAPFANVIRSKTLADTFRALFELGWRGAAKEPGMTAAERMEAA